MFESGFYYVAKQKIPTWSISTLSMSAEKRTRLQKSGGDKKYALSVIMNHNKVQIFNWAHIHITEVTCWPDSQRTTQCLRWLQWYNYIRKTGVHKGKKPYFRENERLIVLFKQTITLKMADQGRSVFYVVFTMNLCTLDIKQTLISLLFQIIQLWKYIHELWEAIWG